MSPDYRTADLTDDISFDDLVKELDAILDAWFVGESGAAHAEARCALDEGPAAAA